jgi:uncharacterized protein YbjQ (UPF0145 family)
MKHKTDEFNTQEIKMDAMTTRLVMKRNTAGLRDVLLDEIDSLRNGESDQARAHAIARLANAAISSVRLEMDAYAHMDAERKLPHQPLQLAAE